MVTPNRTRSLAIILLLLTTATIRPWGVQAQSRRPSAPRIPAAVAAHAQAHGSARVIVGLDVAYTPEQFLGRSAAQSQRSSIARAQSAVLGRVLRAKPSSIRRFSSIPFLAIEVDETDLQTLAASPEVTDIQIDAVSAPTLAESTPLIGATRAWSAGYTGAGWTVAVLDTGIDSTHPFLAGKVVSEACYSTAVDGRSDNLCPMGITGTLPGSGGPCPIAGCQHGTQVAGIVAGKGDAFSGVARDASLISVQVFSSFYTAADCASQMMTPCVLSYTSDQILGLERIYALRESYHIAAVNMSLGGELFQSPCDSEPMKAIIDQLRAAGIATVIASGNGGSTTALSAPACISSAISVASTTDGTTGPPDLVSSFSNTNQFLSLFAPGEVIKSSIPGGGFANSLGTSLATPHVAGAWAILKSRRPSATVTEILDALVETGTPILDSRNGIVKPRINVDAAFQAIPLARPCTYTVNPTQLTVGGIAGTASVTVTTDAECSWSAISQSSFAVVVGPQTQTSSHTVTIDYAANPTRGIRQGTLQIAGTTVTITQRAAQPDLSGDGRADIFWQNRADGGLVTWSLDNWVVTSSAWLGIDHVNDTNWRVVGSGDLNGDGHVDLVWRHQIDGWLVAWFLSGTQLISSEFLSIPKVDDLNWNVEAVGDIDGDGKADLIWREKQHGWLVAWLMDAARVANPVWLSIPEVADTNWQIAGAGDTNGDGYADLIWQNQSDGALVVWSMKGKDIIASHFLSVDHVSDTNWHIRGVGDADGDGEADLIWQNDADGRLAIWLLDDYNVFGGRMLSIDRVADLNWRIVGPG